MAKSFERIYASSTGDFEDSTSKIPKWITANGGTYSKNVVKGVTHLIATKKAYTQNVPSVAAAKELGNVKIVSYDWLAQSLLSNSRAPRSVKGYLWENILKAEKKGRKARNVKMASKKCQANEGQNNQKVRADSTEVTSERDEAEGEQPRTSKKAAQKAKDKEAGSKSIKKRRKKRGSAKSKDPFDTKPRTTRALSVAGKYHLYEAEGTTYSAKLVRPFNNARTTNEFLYLKIYETIQPAHTYATHIRLTHRGFSKTECLAPLGSDLKTAMMAFKDCFRAQTGKEWEDRLDGVPPLPRMNTDGNVEPPYKGWFWLETEHVSGLASLFRDQRV
ncbi:hypothetical protein BDV18DRAFT_159872 [Aspergillus unguis]